MTVSTCQVAIVGAGPAGLAAATRLRELGVEDVVLLERETAAGGIPRHCGHSPFGMREYRSLLSGPAYARRLSEDALARGVRLMLKTTVVKLGENGLLTLSSDDGEQQLQANAVLLSTGNRESPRAARLVSGSRPQGVVTTGALQSMVYLKGRKPFQRPLVVGTELVSFSALLTCRHARIRPVMMIEPNSRVTAFRMAGWLPPRLLGIPLKLNHSVKTIHGQARVEAVDIEDCSGRTQQVDCDGVIFTGGFVAEASLVRNSHLRFDLRSGGPEVDQYGRCSDPAYFAAGNLLHPVDTAGWCWAEGQRLAEYLLAALEDRLPSAERAIAIETSDDRIRYFTPQRIALPPGDASANDWMEKVQFQLRFNRPYRGRLGLQNRWRTIQSRSLWVRPETRQLLSVPIDLLGIHDKLSFHLGKRNGKSP